MIERHAQINLPIGLLSGLFLNQRYLAGAFLLPPGDVFGLVCRPGPAAGKQRLAIAMPHA
jgi:hypothetical protein